MEAAFNKYFWWIIIAIIVFLYFGHEVKKKVSKGKAQRDAGDGAARLSKAVANVVNPQEYYVNPEDVAFNPMGHGNWSEDTGNDELHHIYANNSARLEYLEGEGGAANFMEQPDNFSFKRHSKGFRHKDKVAARRAGRNAPQPQYQDQGGGYQPVPQPQYQPTPQPQYQDQGGGYQATAQPQYQQQSSAPQYSQPAQQQGGGYPQPQYQEQPQYQQEAPSPGMVAEQMQQMEPEMNYTGNDWFDFGDSNDFDESNYEGQPFSYDEVTPYDEVNEAIDN